MQIHKTLNPQQLKAVKSDLTHQLVMGGFGTVKTSVLLSRADYLIKEQGFSADNIWLITFDNKSASTLRESFAESISPKYIGSFCSSFIWILKQHIHLLGKKEFIFIDNIATKSILKKILKEMPVKVTLTAVFDFIPCLKYHFLNKEFNEEEYGQFLITCPAEFKNLMEYKNAYKIYRHYLDTCHEECSLDYDDIYIYTKRLCEIPEVLEYWTSQFKAILVDEFQDINELQFEILTKLIGENTSVFCVGDADQSLYGLSGAKAEVFESFKEKYPSTTVTILEKSYRSTKNIFNLSQKLINHKRNTDDNKLFTENAPGEKIKYFFAKGIVDESYWLANRIKDIMAKDYSAKYKDILVLFRDNTQSVPIEEELGMRGYPYQIFGTTNLFETEEVQFILRFINLMIFEKSSILEELFDVGVFKGCGNTTVTKIKQHAAEKKQTLFQSIFSKESFSFLNKKQNEEISDFVKTFTEIKSNFVEIDPKKLVEIIIEKTPYKKRLEEKEDEDKIKNLNLFSEMWFSAYSENLKNTLSELALISNEYIVSDKKDAINLSTINCVKGMEFKYVFIYQFMKNILPDSKFKIKKPERDSERRTAYVAMTRAKTQLFISGCDDIPEYKRSHCDLTGESEFMEQLKGSNEIEIVEEEKGLFSKIKKKWFSN